MMSNSESIFHCKSVLYTFNSYTTQEFTYYSDYYACHLMWIILPIQEGQGAIFELKHTHLISILEKYAT